MRIALPLRRRLLAVVSMLAGLVVAAGIWLYLGGKYAQVSYHDSFTTGKMEEWNAFGGTWELYDGGVRNDSDERGAKFITGSPLWKDYRVQADVMLLGQDGDAGLIIRSSHEEEGTDSYRGYYAGLRDHNNSLTIGRAVYGWIEYQAVPVAGGVHAFHWYHMDVVAVGCEIAASITDSVSGQRTRTAMTDEHCARSGRIGLRSYSSGGIWKNIRVTPATANDLEAMTLSVPIATSPKLMQTEAGYNSLLAPPNAHEAEQRNAHSGNFSIDIHQPSLTSLRLVSRIEAPIVTVRGRVILIHPQLYVQDSTGGISISNQTSLPLKIGDEVEVTGVVDPHHYSANLNQAYVRLLWANTPAPPLSVTVSQAATGSFDARFVEVQGYLLAKTRNDGGALILTLQSGHELFRAIMYSQPKDAFFNDLKLNSLLQLRGVCVVDARYTGNLTSFVVLLRSSDDVAVLEGPPWWDTRHLIAIAITFLAIALIGFYLYNRVELWRLRAVLQERSRIAREIHDTLSQGFAAIAMLLECARNEQGRSPSASASSLEMALQMTRQSRAEAHRSIAALRTLHTDESLAMMLRKVLSQQISVTHLQLRIATAGNQRRLSEEVEGQILRIAQECVANSIQHANATCVDMKLTFDKKELLVEIADNGKGFDVQAAPGADDGHFGMAGIRERALRIAANLAIHSERSGTRIFLYIPITQHSRRNWYSIYQRAHTYFAFMKSGNRNG